MKQTAVEYLVRELTEAGCIYADSGITNYIINLAYRLEKQQIIEVHAVGRIKECSGINTDGEQYYNETFKSE